MRAGQNRPWSIERSYSQNVSAYCQKYTKASEDAEAADRTAARGDVDMKLAHMVTDLLATHLADNFGSMNLLPPMDHQGNALLVFRVPVPAPDVLAPRLRFATGAAMIEVFGADNVLDVFARPTERSGGSAAGRDG